MKPLLLAKIWVLYPYAVFSSEKDISSKSEYAQKMHCLQAKIVQNNSKYILVNCDVTILNHSKWSSPKCNIRDIGDSESI